MYEDRFDMFALQMKVLEGLNEKETDRISWWKKIMFHKPAATAPPLHYIFIRQMSLAVKRTEELRALSGWYLSSSVSCISLYALSPISFF